MDRAGSQGDTRLGSRPQSFTYLDTWLALDPWRPWFSWFPLKRKKSIDGVKASFLSQSLCSPPLSLLYPQIKWAEIQPLPPDPRD